jgi:hypothetical protein
MVGDFHALGRFGELVFTDADGHVPSPTPPALAAAPGMAQKVAGAAKAPAAPAAGPDRKTPAASKGGDVHAKK